MLLDSKWWTLLSKQDFYLLASLYPWFICLYTYLIFDHIYLTETFICITFFMIILSYTSVSLLIFMMKTISFPPSKIMLKWSRNCLQNWWQYMGTTSAISQTFMSRLGHLPITTWMKSILSCLSNSNYLSLSLSICIWLNAPCSIKDLKNLCCQSLESTTKKHYILLLLSF